jgi:hypothetical protein
MKKIVFAITVVAVLAPLLVEAASGKPFREFEAELEAGPLWQTRNDIQIPNADEGTRFSLVDLAGRGPWPAARLYFTWNISPEHSLRLLLAPLSITETGTLDSSVAFEGETYEPGIPTEATYKFNSWRVTYRYRFYGGGTANHHVRPTSASCRFSTSPQTGFSHPDGMPRSIWTLSRAAPAGQKTLLST